MPSTWYCLRRLHSLPCNMLALIRACYQLFLPGKRNLGTEFRTLNTARSACEALQRWPSLPPAGWSLCNMKGASCAGSTFSFMAEHVVEWWGTHAGRGAPASSSRQEESSTWTGKLYLPHSFEDQTRTSYFGQYKWDIAVHQESISKRED